VKLRNHGGTDVVLLADQGEGGLLTPSGALAVRRSTFALGELFEYRAGAVSTLGPIGFVQATGEPLLAVEGNWAAWMTSPTGTATIRRDLVAGTDLTIAAPAAGASRASLDVGYNGDVAYEYYYGGGSGGTSIIKLYHDGTHTTVYGSSSVGLARPKTDGGNVTFTTLSLFTGYELWLWRAGTTERLAQTALSSGAQQINLASRHAGEWTAYLYVSGQHTPGQYTQVRLRTPANVDEPVSRPSGAGLLEALCPDGSVVYSEGTYSGGTAFYTRRYIAYRGGPLVDVGPTSGNAVVCRGGRFFLLSGGAGYELSL
jgi:hypothetical protein